MHVASLAVAQYKLCVHPARPKRSASRRRPVAHDLAHAIPRSSPRALPRLDFATKGVRPAHVCPKTERGAHGAAGYLECPACVADAGTLAVAPEQLAVHVPGHVVGLPCGRKQGADLVSENGVHMRR